VNTTARSYPQYLKDSILNTNPNFDYGQFLVLKTTIDTGKTVTAFSFVFNDPGVYVFQDSVNVTKVTIIGVVKESQDCSTKDANVQSATASALASIGIAPQSKNVRPNWSFIIGTFVFIILISFGFVTLVVYLHNKNEAQNVKGTSKKHQIYYDRVNQKEEDELNRSKWYRFLICRGCNRLRGRLDEYLNQVAPQGPADNGANGDIDITYKDLQTLINEFRDQMEVLKSKLSSQAPEEVDQADLDGDGNIDEEEALI
jgi:hypothetical protein